jgi:hypothetical protein
VEGGIVGSLSERKYLKGSKRRVAQIRWKRGEVIHATILAAIMLAFCIWVAIWINTHTFD